MSAEIREGSVAFTSYNFSNKIDRNCGRLQFIMSLFEDVHEKRFASENP